MEVFNKEYVFELINNGLVIEGETGKYFVSHWNTLIADVTDGGEEKILKRIFKRYKVTFTIEEWNPPTKL